MMFGSLGGKATARKGVSRRSGTLVALTLVVVACDRSVADNPDYRPPAVSEGAAGRVVLNRDAIERWLPRRGVPAQPVFLFSGALAAARAQDGRQAVLPPTGDRLLVFDRRGRFVGDAGLSGLIRAIAVVPWTDGWLVVERDGRVVSTSGPTFVPQAFATPATLARAGDRFIAGRSPYVVPVHPEPTAAPLLVAIDPNGATRTPIDTIVSATSPDPATASNAGHLAGDDSTFFFAFLARDEVRAYGADGVRRWTASRALSWGRPPSRRPEAVDVPFVPVNLAVAEHRGTVYALANAGPAADSIRIDGFDAATGVLRRTATLPAAAWLISTDADGALWYAPADTLAVLGAPVPARRVAFRLPTFDGDTVDLEESRGKVVLLNFWASWCGPCRDEFPYMASLFRELGGADFTVIAVSDDVDAGAARRFLAEFDPPFPTAWGRGTLEPTLGYRGLPFTLLLDREGRVVSRYFGFGGVGQVARLRDEIRRLISREGATDAARDATSGIPAGSRFPE